MAQRRLVSRLSLFSGCRLREQGSRGEAAGEPDLRAALAGDLERELLPRISGLIAASERKAKRRRLGHYGALRQTLGERGAP